MNLIFLSSIFGILFMLRSVFSGGEHKKNQFIDLSLIFGAILILIVATILESPTFGGVRFSPFDEADCLPWLVVDATTLNIELIILIALGTFFLFMAKRILSQVHPMESVALVFFCLVGMSLMVSYNNLLTLFLAIEIFSLPQYVLAGSRKHKLQSVEAAFKYFVMGAFFSAILMLGITFIFGFTGTLSLEGLTFSLMASSNPAFFYIGVVLVLIALLFKAGIAPFHFWVPDVYTGSPNTVVSFMAGVTKIGVFVLLFRFFRLIEIHVLAEQWFWTSLLSVLILLSLVIANFSALRQTSQKRMIAYSGIAQGAFMLYALFDTSDDNMNGLLTFALGYALCLIGIFYVLDNVGKEDATEEEQNNAFLGLARRKPFQSFLLSVCLLSLAGLPGTAGFLGKFYMFRIGANYGYMWLVLISGIFSGISLYYYMGVIKKIYFYPPVSQDNTSDSHEPAGQKILYLYLMIFIVLIGLGFLPLFNG